MKVYIALQILAALLAVHLLTGCGVSARIDWNGKTGVDNQTVTPEFRTGKLENPFATGSKIQGVTR